MRILVVDDDFFILNGLRKVLQNHHEVHTASDGETAYSMASRATPDVVLVDLLLAWENGLDVVERMRRMLPDADVIAMSGFPGNEIIHEAYACGANGFLPKEELALIHALLDRLEDDRRRARR